MWWWWCCKDFLSLLSPDRPLFNPCVDIAHISWGFSMWTNVNEYCVLKEMFSGAGRGRERLWAEIKCFSSPLPLWHADYVFIQIIWMWMTQKDVGRRGRVDVSNSTPCEQIILYNILIKVHTNILNKFCAMSVPFLPYLVVFLHFMPPERDENHELVEY